MTVPTNVLLETAVVVAALAGVGFVVARIASRRMKERGAPPLHVRTARVVITVVFSLAIVGVLSTLLGPINLVGGVTISAFAGLAATLALQTTLQNIISGFILLRNRSLRLYDTIEVGGVKGRVVRIGVVTTWLRLEDGSFASLANNTLLSGPLRNYSAGDRLKGEF